MVYESKISELENELNTLFPSTLNASIPKERIVSLSPISSCISPSENISVFKILTKDTIKCKKRLIIVLVILFLFSLWSLYNLRPKIIMKPRKKYYEEEKIQYSKFFYYSLWLFGILIVALLFCSIKYKQVYKVIFKRDE